MKKIALFALGATLALAPAAVAQHHDDHHDDHGRPNFHFNDNDRRGFEQHYRKDVDRWHGHPDNRPNPGFRPGERIPHGVRFQSVPSSYYRGLQPPPPGYRYGYYNGYVVAYNPTTQIVADVLDIVANATR